MIPPPGHPRAHNMGDILASVHDEAIKPQHLILDYITYHGRLYEPHQRMFIDRLRRGYAHWGMTPPCDLGFGTVFGRDTRLSPSFLQAAAPYAAGAYFPDGGPLSAQRVEVAPASVNQWFDPEFPARLRVASRSEQRPAIHLLTVEPSADLRLFVSSESYQLFDAARHVAWPAAASRALSTAVKTYREVPVDRPVVLVGDLFEASNFSHFLYDYVPRIIRVATAMPDIARHALFVIGERADHPLQAYILERICARYGLRMEQMILPIHSELWRPSAPIVFSTDQHAAHSHPLHTGNPEMVAAVRDLIAPPELSRTLPRRLYLSRGDARTRRLANEADVLAVLSPLGYMPVRLSEHDAATQIALLANAERIVAPHGMALTGLVFNRAQAHVLELFHPTIGTDAYATVARAIGLPYAYELGTALEGPDVPFRIDPEVLHARHDFLA